MTAGVPLEDRFEILKEIGDGSFGSVALARVRTAGSNVARRGSVLREVIFLSSLPQHIHLVPALDIFLDPYSKKLHIAMEHMDGNLYQLMKSRDHKCLDVSSVKSILFQIMQGLEHIHAHHFFHRDIKPENILVSTSSHQDSGSSFRRYSTLMTPLSTPTAYSVKIADFGLARETHSKLAYTTYVSTRWYRAPEVLLRAGEYSSPVDIWAIGAMAVEIATLKPLFPGGNEVDQVWRVCEIMGSPGNWHSKSGVRIGGGDWKDGTRLAGKLGFSFPKMAPHSMESILQTPQWPASLSNLVTWCLMWDPQNRPSSSQALSHEFFIDAFDPLRPKSSSTRILGRKHSDLSYRSPKESSETTHILSSKSSWFRKSLIGRSEATSDAVNYNNSNNNANNNINNNNINTNPSNNNGHGTAAVPGKDGHPSRPTPHFVDLLASKTHQSSNKRATWNNGPSNGAPMSILPCIKPISPLSDTVTAQASNRSPPLHQEAHTNQRHSLTDEQAGKKIGRQLSIASANNHYSDIHRQEAEMALSGNTGLASPPNGQKESFFSHLRKRARRFSGRQSQIPITPKSMDLETHVGCGPWASNRSSVVMDGSQNTSPVPRVDTYEALDRALRNVQQSLDSSSNEPHNASMNNSGVPKTILKRHHSLPQQAKSIDNLRGIGPISSRTRRSQIPPGAYHYETPAEEDELLDEELKQTRNAMIGLKRSCNQPENNSPSIRQSSSNLCLRNPYPTPSPSANGNNPQVSPVGVISDLKQSSPRPDEQNEWATSAAASILAASSYF